MEESYIDIRAGAPLACSRLVMMDWGEKYQNILLRADLKISLLKSYVDDIRQICSLLEKGKRFNIPTMNFEWREEWE